MIWHILTACPQREFRAGIELQRLGLATVIPYTIRHRKQMGKGNRPIMVPYKVPLMPSYVFIGGDVPWYDVRSLRDIRGRVEFDGRPARLSDLEMDHVRRLAETERKDDRKGLKAGDTVRMTDGPLRDLTALVQEIGLGSVRVDVELFGRPTPVTIRPDQIERVA